MKTLALIILLFAVSAMAGDVKIVQKTSGNQSPVIVVGKGGKNTLTYNNRKESNMDCQKRLYDALEDLLKYVEPSTGIGSTTLEYITPSEQLRRNADRMERQDAAINRAKKILEECKP